jgi:chitinase
MKDRKVKQVLSGGWHQWKWGGHKERVEGECAGNTMSSCTIMEK